jgi:hypothetical protein
MPALGFIGNVPLFEAVVALILIVGAIYYLVAQRNAPETRAVAPAEARA